MKKERKKEKERDKKRKREKKKKASNGEYVAVYMSLSSFEQIFVDIYNF